MILRVSHIKYLINKLKVTFSIYFINVIEELQNAIDEIKNNEKEISMISMVAQTLFDRLEEQSDKLVQYEGEITQYSVSARDKEAELNEMKGSEYNNRAVFERLEMIKLDTERELESQTSKCNRM